MAYRGVSYGLSAQVKKKLEGKRDPEQEEEVLTFIEAHLSKKFDRSTPYEDHIRTGEVLCDLINAIKPGSVKKINRGATAPFKIMENINAFQDAIQKYGVPVLDVFQTVDLFEKKDIGQVTQCLFALGRTCQSHDDYKGPILGPKLSSGEKHEWTDEQLREGSTHIGLQAGTNKGASQAGMTFGKQRMIND